MNVADFKNSHFSTFLKEEFTTKLSSKATKLGSPSDECIRPGMSNPEGKLKSVLKNVAV